MSWKMKADIPFFSYMRRWKLPLKLYPFLPGKFHTIKQIKQSLPKITYYNAPQYCFQLLLQFLPHNNQFRWIIRPVVLPRASTVIITEKRMNKKEKKGENHKAIATRHEEHKSWIHYSSDKGPVPSIIVIMKGKGAYTWSSLRIKMILYCVDDD